MNDSLENVGEIVRTCDRRRGDSRASLHTHCFLRVDSVAHSSLAFWKFLELFYEHVRSTADVFQAAELTEMEDFCAAGDQNLKKGTPWFSVVQGTLDLVSQDNQRPMMLPQTGV